MSGRAVVLLQSSAGWDGGSLGKWILFSDASTRVRGLTAHYSGPNPLCSLTDGWQGLLGGGAGGGGWVEKRKEESRMDIDPSCLPSTLLALLL